MSRAIVFVSSFFLGVIVLGATTPARAQGIGVSPSELVFGQVELGVTEILSLELTSTEPQPLTIYTITLGPGSDDAFFIDAFLVDGVPIAGVPPSLTLWTADLLTLELLVGFSPLSPGAHTGSIRLDSDAEPPRQLLFIDVSGSGASSVTAVSEPASIVLLATVLVSLSFLRRRSG